MIRRFHLLTRFLVVYVAVCQFMESELALDESIHALQQLATASQFYPLLLEPSAGGGDSAMDTICNLIVKLVLLTPLAAAAENTSLRWVDADQSLHVIFCFSVTRIWMWRLIALRC